MELLSENISNSISDLSNSHGKTMISYSNSTKLINKYFNIFIDNVEKEKYDTALESIILVQEKFDFDCSVYIFLLNIILGNNVKKLKKTNNIFGYYDLHPALMNSYNVVIDSINNNQYLRAIRNLHLCNNLIQNHKYKIDLSIIEELVKVVYCKQIETAKKEKVEECIFKFFNSDNCGIEYYTLKKLVDLDKSDLNLVGYLIEILIKFGDYKQAKMYLESISDDGSTYIKYLKETIDEIYLNKDNYLSSVKKIESIKNKVNSDDLESAIVECDEFYKKTNNNDFVFYEAEIYYLNGNYSEALSILLKYISIGKKYLREANIYIYFILNQLGANNNSDSYLSCAYDLCTYQSSMTYTDFENEIKQINSFSSGSLLKVQKKMLYNKKYEEKKQYINKIG